MTFKKHLQTQWGKGFEALLLVYLNSIKWGDFIKTSLKEKKTEVLPNFRTFSHLNTSLMPGNFGSPGTENNNTYKNKNQEVQFLETDSELSKKFIPKKYSSLLLSESYSRLGFDKKSERVFNCGTFLEFAHEISDDGEICNDSKLHNANFCKDRLCPLCSWRRSYKIFGQVSQIMEKIEKNYEFLFLTLTVPSVSDTELKNTISRLFSAWGKFVRKKEIKTICKGYFRALEVTRNNNAGDKAFGLYHPHFHAVIAVDKNYFTCRDYINHDTFLNLWRSSYGDFSINQVNIQKAHSKKYKGADCLGLSSVVAEIAKYTVKSSDYIYPDNPCLTDSIVSTLNFSLSGRRLVSFAGCFKKAFQELKLEDIETADLVHINDKINPALTFLICRYGWSAGVYKMTDMFIQINDVEGVKNSE